MTSSLMFSRRSFLGVAAALILGALLVIYTSVWRESHRQDVLGVAAKPFIDQGFTVVDFSKRGDPTKLEATIEAGCIVATSANPSRLKISHPAGITEGPGPIVTCLCAPGTVRITSAKAAGGMVLLRIDAASLGGSRAFAYLPFKPGTTATNDAACADASLDAWLDAKKYPAPAPDNAFVAARPALGKASFTVIATLEPEFPFAVLEVPANDCLVAIDDKADKVGFRIKGGAVPIAPALGNLAFCTTTATTMIVDREGQGVVNALLAPAEKIGGSQGLREIMASVALRVDSFAVPATDEDWIAKQLFLASDIGESLISVGREPNDPDFRLTSISAEKPGMLTPDAGEGVYSFCDPSLASARSSLCAFSGPQTWKLERHDAITGMARAKLPFWLFGLKDVAEPEAMKLATQVITLVRRLKREGFEATTFEGVIENATSTEVLGRANEDSVIAVMLAPTWPWAIPLADKGAWALDGDPMIVPIKPLQRIQLVAPPKTKLPLKGSRRTVVFRHHA